jgi:hypothetical protein
MNEQVSAPHAQPFTRSTGIGGDCVMVQYGPAPVSSHQTQSQEARRNLPRARGTQQREAATRLPCPTIHPLRHSLEAPSRTRVDSHPTQRQIHPGHRWAPAFWSADGWSRLHLFTVRLWDGQKDLIPSARCVVGDLKFLRNGASLASTRSLSANWSVVPSAFHASGPTGLIPPPYDALTRPPHRLAVDCLFELVALLEALAGSRPSSPGKDTKKSIDKGDA